MRIETERLVITEFDLSMAESVHTSSQDEAVRRFQPDEVFETVEEAQRAIEFLISCYGGREGPLVYPVLLRDGRYAGHVELVRLRDAASAGPEWEVGYQIAAQHRGHGYAAEAVRAFLPRVMRALGAGSVLGVCLTENRTSRAVLERCGFTLEYEGPGAWHGEQRAICRYVYRLDDMDDMGA